MKLEILVDRQPFKNMKTEYQKLSVATVIAVAEKCPKRAKNFKMHFEDTKNVFRFFRFTLYLVSSLYSKYFKFKLKESLYIFFVLTAYCEHFLF